MAIPKKLEREGKPDVWLARWRDPDGKQRKKTFEKKSLAVAHLAAVQADMARGVYVNADDPTTVTAAAWAWIGRRTVRAGTRKRLESLIRCHIEAVPLGRRRLAAVRTSEVHAWATDRGKVLGPATMRKLVGLLKAIYADAVLDRIVATNPVVRVRLTPISRKRIVPLTVAQVLALADAMPPRYRALVLVQAALGLRIGELLGLRVADVDFLRRTVRIEHQSDEETRELVEPKTESSRRTLPLPQWAANALAAHLAAFPAGHDVACVCPRNVDCSRVASGLLFHVAAGTALDQDYYGRRVLYKAVTNANAAEELPKNTTSHDLRHHFASVLIAAGESVVAVAEWLGHENATLVLTTYGHLMPQSEDRMRKAIDAAYGLSADSCAPGVPSRSSIKR